MGLHSEFSRPRPLTLLTVSQSLSDFRSSSCGQVWSYIWLWFLGIVSIAVYGSDTFTAINLLALHQWSPTFSPLIPVLVAKWVFTGCILLSFVLLAYDWMQAIRIMRRGNVAESYLNPLAVTVQSMRVFGGGQGWRRFLVFAELTKSKKRGDYVCLFVYFQLQGAVRVVLAEGPRQAINCLTLYSVLSPGDSSASNFFMNIKRIWQNAPEQAVVLGSMAFSLFIWLFSAVCLLIALLVWVTFLWHYIPSESRTLSRYCRAKVDKRLSRIVNTKTKEAIAADDARRLRDAENVGEKDRPGSLTRQPTLPTFDDKMPKISVTAFETPVQEKPLRRPTLPTLGQPSTESEHQFRQATLPQLVHDNAVPAGQEVRSDVSYRRPVGASQRSDASMRLASQPPYSRPGPPSRSTTQSSAISNSSLASNFPLLANAAYPGLASSGSRHDLPLQTRSFNDEDHYSPSRDLSRVNTIDSSTSGDQQGRMGPSYEMQLSWNESRDQLHYRAYDDQREQSLARASSFAHSAHSGNRAGPMYRVPLPPAADTFDRGTSPPEGLAEAATIYRRPTLPRVELEKIIDGNVPTINRTPMKRVTFSDERQASGPGQATTPSMRPRRMATAPLPSTRSDMIDSSGRLAGQTSSGRELPNSYAEPQVQDHEAVPRIYTASPESISDRSDRSFTPALPSQQSRPLQNTHISYRAPTQFSSHTLSQTYAWESRSNW